MQSFAPLTHHYEDYGRSSSTLFRPILAHCLGTSATDRGVPLEETINRRTLMADFAPMNTYTTATATITIMQQPSIQAFSTLTDDDEMSDELLEIDDHALMQGLFSGLTLGSDRIE